jgi:uncharacterized protein YjbI with pentapeptide repeats
MKRVFSEHQERFIATFTLEFVRELQFLADVKEERAQPRATFFDKLIGKINFGTAVLTTLTGFFPLASGAIGGASQLISWVVTGVKYLYEADVNINIRAVIGGSKQPELLLQILIEGIAREAARRYEFFLNNMCVSNDVDLFAVVGIARVLQYLSDNKDLSFTSENLMKGFKEGKSGAWQQGFTDNYLSSRHFNVSNLSAECVYGHSGVMALNRKYYLKQKHQNYFSSKSLNYVKMVKNQQEKMLPRAGVVLLPDREITMAISEGFQETPISPELNAHLLNYCPGYVILTRKDIEKYMEFLNSSKTLTSLSEYFGSANVICRDDLSNLNLDGGNFANTDFSGANMTGTKLNGATFEHSYLVSVDFRKVEAKNAKFCGANLSLVNGEDGIFDGCDFTQAVLRYCCFIGANFSGIQFVGSEWQGSNLSGIVSSSLSQELLTGKLVQLSNTLVDKCAFRLMEIENKIIEYLEDQDHRVAKSVEAKLRDLKEQVLSNVYLTEELSLYVPVEARLNIGAPDSFDLLTKVEDFLVSSKEVLLILGEAGQGKSTFNRFIYKRLWEKWTSHEAVPLLMSLPSLDNPDTQLIQEVLHREHLTSEEILFIQKNYKLIVIADGYDELNYTPNLFVSNCFDGAKLKLIVSCRRQFVLQFPHYDRCFKPIYAEKFIDSAFQEYTIAPFNEMQITNYIREYLISKTTKWSSVEGCRQQMSKLAGLDVLITTPYLLHLALDVLPDIIENYKDYGMRKKVTKDTLYKYFMENYFDRAEAQTVANVHLRSSGWLDMKREFRQAAQNLAVEMSNAEVMEVHFSTDRYNSNPDWFRESFSHYEIREVRSTELETTTLQEDALLLLYVTDEPKNAEKWRIVARNNARGVTHHFNSLQAKFSWLTVSDLRSRWTSRISTVEKYQVEINYKSALLKEVTSSILVKHPSALTGKEKEKVFSVIVLALTHPWHRFFNFADDKIRQVFHGLPVNPTNRGSYAFIHSEILEYFHSEAIVQSAQSFMSIMESPTDIVRCSSNDEGNCETRLPTKLPPSNQQMSSCTLI